MYFVQYKCQMMHFMYKFDMMKKQYAHTQVGCNEHNIM